MWPGEPYSYNVMFHYNGDDFTKIGDIKVSGVDTLDSWLAEQKEREKRAIVNINFNNETKEMTISYIDGTKKVFNNVEIQDICVQSAGLDNEGDEYGQAEIVYNFKNYEDDFGKYVDNFEKVS